MDTWEAVQTDSQHYTETPYENQIKPISATLVSGVLRCCDVFVVGLVAVGVYLLYVYPQAPGPADSGQYLGTILVCLFISGLLFQWVGVYDSDDLLLKNLRVYRVLSAWAVAFAIFLAIAFILKSSDFYSRVWVISWFVISAVLLGVIRKILSYYVDRWVRDGRFGLRTIILGAGKQGQRLVKHLAEHNDLSARIIGFIDDRKSRIPSESNGYRVLGDMNQLLKMIRAGLVDQVFIALPWDAEDRVHDSVSRIATTPVHICLAPGMAGFEFLDRPFIQVAHLAMLKIFDRPLSGWAHVFKTIEDWVLALLCIVFFGPLMLLIALAIKLDSPGPVFFKQKRYGFNNELIDIWKFRTMHTSMTDPDCDVQSVIGDSRATRIGHFLRKSSLDELPQLFNVLSGNMSIVGPRPHAISTKAEGFLFAEVVDGYAARHRVKPGITGWAQVNGWRGAADTVEKIKKRVDLDLYYIDNWSIWFDLVIIIRTIFVVLKGKNAY